MHKIAIFSVKKKQTKMNKLYYTMDINLKRTFCCQHLVQNKIRIKTSAHKHISITKSIQKLYLKPNENLKKKCPQYFKKNT